MFVEKEIPWTHPPGTYIKVLAATVHLHALQSLYSGVKIYTEQWSC